MPTMLPLVNITVGAAITVPVGTSQLVGAITLANESPYGLLVSVGAQPRWIPALTIDRVDCASGGFNGNVTLTAVDYLSFGSSAPSFVALINAYAPGEPITGTYPAALTRLVNAGNVSVATQLINTGNAAGQQLISSTVGGAINPAIVVTNDGAVDVQVNNNGTLTDVLHIAPGSNITAASFILKLLQVVGVVKLDGGLIYTDGSGNLFVGKYPTGGGTASVVQVSIAPLSATLPPQTLNIGGLGTSGSLLYFLYSATATPGPSAKQSHVFQAFVNGSLVDALEVGGHNDIAAVSWIDGVGVLHATAPVTLAPGNQETGFCGNQAYIPAGQALAFSVNFKTVMTNTPTGVTLSVQASANTTGAISSSQFQKYGFWAFINASATALTQWNGTYVTVGNCLLAVDAAAQTFDHHCDACGQVGRNVPFEALSIAAHAGHHTLAYVCPACGATECFNCDLSAADEADTSPQGSGEYVTTRGAQATLIRALQTALGLPLA